MNRLHVRLVLSHLLVALVGALATFLVSRQLAPALFDHGMPMRGMGFGDPAAVRQQVGDALDRSLVVGTLVGVAVAAAAGAFAATRLVQPLTAIRGATRALAEGRYGMRVPAPRERELAELAEDINTLASTLAETESRRLRLLGDVTHEMRTPLTVIDGYLEGMIDGVVPATADQLAEVGTQVRRLRRLTDDLSLLSRTQEGRVEFHPVDLDLREVVSAAAERLRSQAADAGLTLTVETGSQDLAVRADADRVAQVVTNLVGNAIRATPAGGSIEVRCHAESDQVVTTVSDTGEGLAASELERVFERFYRASGRRTDGRGSGVGLTIARDLAQAQGGSLVADSAGLGSGATFTLSLPRRAG